MKNSVTARQYIGALLYDLPLAIKTSGRTEAKPCRIPWVHMHNRAESLLPDLYGVGVKCDWKWTSDLYLPKIFPSYGRWLFRRAFKDFPLALNECPTPKAMRKPQVSFIIGHRGIERLPLLLATLQSIAGQKDCRFECVVVEQDTEMLIKDELPSWVRYVHTPLPQKNMAYSRSWAFNVGADASKSDLLIFHDNDMLVPEVYAMEMLNKYKSGSEVINIKRFIFFLDKKSSLNIRAQTTADFRPAIETIMQNAEGGGSVAITRSAFYDIGGFDEGFIGWGGEDNEFWERANTRKVYPYGYLPVVHLWHDAQPEKKERVNSMLESTLRFQNWSVQPAEARIRELTKKS